MAYLKEHIPQKEYPKSLLSRAQTAITVTKNYFHHPKPVNKNLQALKVARYARGEDYHRFFQQELNTLAENLKTLYPEEDFLAFSDSKPVMERDLAYRAGMGWFGKNTCILSKNEGSFFLIGEIYTSLPLSTIGPLNPLASDHCGTCTRCIDACPTNAIKEGLVLNATSCISYWTIEAKADPPEALRKSFGSWFFGCDICQEVCPWNQKRHPELKNNKPTTSLEKLTQEIVEILRSSNKSLQKRFAGTPLTRTGGNGLKRNAIIVATNYNLCACIEDIKVYKDHKRLGSISKWALKEMQNFAFSHFT